MFLEKKAAGILVVVILAAGGCASTTGLERAERTTTLMETVENDIVRTLDEIEGIESTLQELIRPGQRDISSAFERYTSHVNELQDYGNSLITHTQDLETQAEDYFSGWASENQNFENVRLQEIGERRRAEVQSQYEEAESIMTGLDSDIERYINQNREIETFLSNDLTADGVEAITPVVEEAMQEGDNLRYDLISLQESLEDTRMGMDRRGRF